MNTLKMDRERQSKTTILDLFILKIKLLIMLSDLPHDPARIADCDYPRGDIMGHDTACTDDRVVSDGHPGHDESSRTDPAVVSDANRGVILQAFRA